jgi:cysteine sulfinate desulfinase/cysteine desulfurase-like protein
MPMHMDAQRCCPIVGKIAVRVDELGVICFLSPDIRSMRQGHRGTVYPPRVQLEKIIHGAEHEMNKRAEQRT